VGRGPSSSDPPAPDGPPAGTDDASANETVGTFLRRLRESRALTLEAVALETRISVMYLRQIEQNRFEALPGEVFVRGFLRAYARAVGVDPARVILAYERRHGTPDPPDASRWPKLLRLPRRRRLGLLVGVVLALAMLALLFAFVFRDDLEPPPPLPTDAPPAADDAGTLDAEPPPF
jgi:cytoskeletal protein RodZ